MATVFIFHGIQGSAEENWFPWLKGELLRRGHTVIVPSFPHADVPSLREWREHFAQYEEEITLSTVLIGHSLGAAFALRLLEEMHSPVRATFLVAAVYGEMGNEFDPLMQGFVSGGFDWKKVKENAGHVAVLHSDCDPYIAQEKGEALAQTLGVSLTLVPGAGHFNSAAGYAQFPLLLSLVESAIGEA